MVANVWDEHPKRQKGGFDSQQQFPRNDLLLGREKTILLFCSRLGVGFHHKLSLFRCCYGHYSRRCKMIALRMRTRNLSTVVCIAVEIVFTTTLDYVNTLKFNLS